MSKYNHYAVKLDEAFKEARNKCLESIDKLNKAQEEYEKSKQNFTERYIGERGVVRAKTSAMLKDAQNNFIDTYKSAWSDFFNVRDKLSRSLAAELDSDYKIDPACIDSSVLTFINSGVCSAKDLADLAEKFADNNTMKRYISVVASANADSDKISREEKAAFVRVAKNTDTTSAAEKIKENWETLNECAKKFSASHRGTAHIDNHVGYVSSMMKHWDDVAPNVESF